MAPHFILRPMDSYDGTPVHAEIQSASYSC
jgi:hypothetical protein